MRRADVMQALSDVMFFGSVVASRLGSSKSVEVRVSTTPDDPAHDFQEVWGSTPGIICRPPAGAEAFGIDLGSERIVLGLKDRRYQIEVADGECIVRAIAPGAPAYVKLKPDGTVEVHASAIKLGSDEASKKTANAQPLQTMMTSLYTALNATVATQPVAAALAALTPQTWAQLILAIPSSKVTQE